VSKNTKYFSHKIILRYKISFKCLTIRIQNEDETLLGQFEDINFPSIAYVFQPHAELIDPVQDCAKWADNQHCLHFGVLVVQ